MLMRWIKPSSYKRRDIKIGSIHEQVTIDVTPKQLMEAGLVQIIDDAKWATDDDIEEIVFKLLANRNSTSGCYYDIPPIEVRDRLRCLIQEVKHQ